MLRDTNLFDDIGNLVIVDKNQRSSAPEIVTEALGKDQVTIIRGSNIEDAERIIEVATKKLDLFESLEIQAGFATFAGHRSNIGKYFMTVNSRSDYQYICPHSEGTGRTKIQLAAFYCIENTTDGGHTLLFKPDQSSNLWDKLRQRTIRCKLIGNELSKADEAKAKAHFRIVIPDDLLGEEDEIVAEGESGIPSLRIFSALSPLKKEFSRILGKDIYSYWENVGSVDVNTGKEFRSILESLSLMREPTSDSEQVNDDKMDYDLFRRARDSGVKQMDLFSNAIALKLEAGDFVVYNNMSWTHSVSNWTPDSGKRMVAAAFA